MEYSRNVPKKKGTQPKYAKFWNMEYSKEYSWNIPKKASHALGA